MKKKIIMGGLTGIAISTHINLIISVIASIALGKGKYYMVTPEFSDAIGNELNATIIALIIIIAYGFICGAVSAIYWVEKLNFMLQNIIHMTTIFLTTILMGIIMKWFDFNILDIAIFISIFIVIYAIIWTSIYLYWKNKFKKINEGLKK